uniref:Putative secreted protein n=1 Tax=Anopheles marajoara TaxID=58244 RepID=A0A2M4C951_9DIPT
MIVCLFVAFFLNLVLHFPRGIGDSRVPVHRSAAEESLSLSPPSSRFSALTLANTHSHTLFFLQIFPSNVLQNIKDPLRKQDGEGGKGMHVVSCARTRT